MAVGRRATWFVSALKDEGKTKTGVGKKVEIMMIRVRQILHLSHLTKPQVLWECINSISMTLS
jgi:hypothetical protein